MVEPRGVLLDTHVLLWWKAGGERLSSRAAFAIDASRSILISPISGWEIGMLAAKGRVTLDRAVLKWVQDVLAADELKVADLTLSITVAAADLPDFHGDPADRIIYATARELGVQLLSKDARMAEYARQHGDVAVGW